MGMKMQQEPTKIQLDTVKLSAPFSLRVPLLTRLPIVSGMENPLPYHSICVHMNFRRFGSVTMSCSYSIFAQNTLEFAKLPRFSIFVRRALCSIRGARNFEVSMKLFDTFGQNVN